MSSLKTKKKQLGEKDLRISQELNSPGKLTVRIAKGKISEVWKRITTYI